MNNDCVGCYSGCAVDMHNKTDFDVDFPNQANVLENLLLLYRIDPMGRYIGFCDSEITK